MNLCQKLNKKLPVNLLHITTHDTTACKRQFNSNIALITRINRSKYCRQYPSLMVFPNGSTVTVRHDEPKMIIKMPKLLEDCKTEAERKEWIYRRKLLESVKLDDEDSAVKYDPRKYINIMKSSRA